MANSTKIMKITRKAAEIISAAYGKVTLSQLKNILSENKEVVIVTKVAEGCFLERQLSPLPKWWGKGYKEDFDTTLLLVSCHMYVCGNIHMGHAETKFVSTVCKILENRDINSMCFMTWKDYDYISNLTMSAFLLNKLNDWKNAYGVKKFIDACKTLDKHGFDTKSIAARHYAFIKGLEEDELVYLHELVKDIDATTQEKQKIIDFIASTREYLYVLADTKIDWLWASRHIHRDDAYRLVNAPGAFWGEEHDNFWCNFKFAPNIKYILFNYLSEEEIIKLDFEKISRILIYFKGGMRFKYILKFYSLDRADDLMNNGITAKEAVRILATE